MENDLKDTVDGRQTADAANEEAEFLALARKRMIHTLPVARRLRRSQDEYYANADIFDFLREDIAEMQGFFSWLDYNTSDPERIQAACHYYLIHPAATDEEKEKLAHDLTTLTAFCTTLTAYRPPSSP